MCTIPKSIKIIQISLPSFIFINESINTAFHFLVTIFILYVACIAQLDFMHDIFAAV